ncbi:MAG: hypothetical protein E7331_06665 [Clostridiales bacterium]|nr:hypothetical protein [Clostridiales bacterium]
MEGKTAGMMRRFRELGGEERYRQFRKQLANEINALEIPGVPEVDILEEMQGSDIPREYALCCGEKYSLLRKDGEYFGARVTGGFDGMSQYLLLAGMDFLLVAELGPAGTLPELMLWKRR